MNIINNVYSIKILFNSWNKEYKGYWCFVIYFFDIGPFIYQEVTRADIDEFTESTTSILKCVDSELEMLLSLWIIYCINLKTFKDP